MVAPIHCYDSANARMPSVVDHVLGYSCCVVVRPVWIRSSERISPGYSLRRNPTWLYSAAALRPIEKSFPPHLTLNGTPGNRKRRPHKAQSFSHP